MVEDHTPGVETDSRVFVNQTRVPVADIDIHVRNEGPASITRYAEGEIASPFQGVDYIDAFDGVDDTESQDSFDTVRIDVRDYETGQYATQFHGIVTGVGNSTGLSRIWKFRAQGPGLLLDNIEASKRFSGEVGVLRDEVLTYIRNRLSEKLPFSVGGGQVGEFEPPESTDLSDSDAISETGAIDAAPINREENIEAIREVREDRILDSQWFRPNRHTVTDVVNWFERKTGTRLWITPTGGGGSLFATANPTGAPPHTAHYLNGDNTIRVVNNDALSELRPVNTLVVAGKADRSTNSVGQYEQSEPPSGRYVRAVARHDGLYRRAGETELRAQRDYESDSQQKSTVESEARRLLADEIEGATGGDMQTLLRSPIQPFDIVRAQPTCDEEAGTNTQPVDYEVSRVTYRIRPDDISHCQVNVGVKVDPQEDISVESSWEEI